MACSKGGMAFTGKEPRFESRRVCAKSALQTYSGCKSQSEVSSMLRVSHSVSVVLFGVSVVPVPWLLVASGQDARTAYKPPQPTWSAAAAERYLDGREEWWQKWDRAQKDHGTLCVSCHTQATYGWLVQCFAKNSEKGNRLPRSKRCWRASKNGFAIGGR
jgi:hypothetical protein